MRPALLLAAVLLAGCIELQKRTYHVKFIQPDGDVYRTLTIQSEVPPWITSLNGTVWLEVWPDRRHLVPTGWMVEIDPASEKE